VDANTLALLQGPTGELKECIISGAVAVRVKGHIPKSVACHVPVLQGQEFDPFLIELLIRGVVMERVLTRRVWLCRNDVQRHLNSLALASRYG
jgi:hypothetical protein